MIDFEDLIVLARTVWGEARGEPREGQIAVAWVVLNRWRSGRWFAGRTIAETCLKPRQFSCWNMDDANREKALAVTMDDASFRRCVAAAALALADDVDPTLGATHYHAAGAEPGWARNRKPAAIIGRHLFFRDIE